MDDTLADESGIPVISNSDDIPVHSTPIKGSKVPLPSTRHLMKAMFEKGKTSTFNEQEISELPNDPEERSLSHHKSTGHGQKTGDASSHYGRKQYSKADSDKDDRGMDKNLKSSEVVASLAAKQTSGRQHVLSREKSNELHPHHHPRSASDSSTRFYPPSHSYDYDREDNLRSHVQSKHPRSHSASSSQQNDIRYDISLGKDTEPKSPDSFDKSSKRTNRELKFKNSTGSSLTYDAKAGLTYMRDGRPRSPFTLSNLSSQNHQELKFEKTSSLKQENMREFTERMEKHPGSPPTFETLSSKSALVTKAEKVKSEQNAVSNAQPPSEGNANKLMSDQVEGDYLSKPHSPSDQNINAFSRYAFSARESQQSQRQSHRQLELTPENKSERQTYRQLELTHGDRSAGVQTVENDGSPRLKHGTTVSKLGDRTSEMSPLARRRLIPDTAVEGSNVGMKSLSTSVKQVSYSEMEMTTIQKQRQEIQMLVAELKDRDRELGDMMNSHQQQLLAWEQDRQRVFTLDRKCTQYESDLQSKSVKLQNAYKSLKTLKLKYAAQTDEAELNKITVERLLRENDQLKQQLAQYKDKCEMLQNTVQELSSSVGRLQAREEELNTSLKLKEKDIISATSQMKELSDRLRQLDSRCKECQDREKEALKERNEWKQKCEDSAAELQSLRSASDTKSKQISQLEEELLSLRHHLSVLQRDTSMREKCQEELIESMRIKQERTDSQLKNFRELYERQLQELSKLQLQLDTSKDIITKQQSSLDEQQLSGSYSIRGNSRLSDRSPERQRNTVNQTSRYRDTDSEVHNSQQQHTQSSGYQTQVSGNQSELLESQSVAGAQLHFQPHRSQNQEIPAGYKINNDYAKISQGKSVSKGETCSNDVAFKRPEISPKHVRLKGDDDKRQSIKETSARRQVPNFHGATNKRTPPGSPRTVHSEPLSVHPQTKLESCEPVPGSPPRKDGYVISQTDAQEADCEKQYISPYVFEDRLCSFLEDVDDIDDNIWDDQGNLSKVIPEVEGSSPASKLLNLLMESRKMIKSLEDTASSPTSKQGPGSEGQGDQK